jgi:solute carrier family 25 protein 39/40
MNEEIIESDSNTLSNRSILESYAKISIIEKILAASVGGTITATVVCPFDVVKARLQAQIDYKSDPNLHNLNTLSKSRFTGTMDAFFKIARYEGIPNLWRGLTPSLAMAVPSNAIYFISYEGIRDSLLKHTDLGIITVPILAGFGARVVSASVTSPLELIRTNLQATSAVKGSSSGLKTIAIKVVNRGGIKSLWAGLPPTILRDAPFSAIYWSAYECISRWISRHSKKERGFAIDFVSGACAGMLAAIFTTPIDVIKTRRQMNLGTMKDSTGPYKMIDICNQIIKDEGIWGLTKGMFPRAAKVAPACAIMISSYEFCKKIIVNNKS